MGRIMASIARAMQRTSQSPQASFEEHQLGIGENLHPLCEFETDRHETAEMWLTRVNTGDHARSSGAGCKVSEGGNVIG